MDTIRVPKLTLLEILKKNRDNHRAMFLDAQQGYREEVIKVLDARLKDAREGRKINLHFSMPAPIDQTKDYNIAIEMLEMAVDDIIELTAVEFRNYVKDDWSWRQNVTATNMLYAKGTYEITE